MASVVAMVCPHCRRCKVQSGRRGLCIGCHHKPDVRALYPAVGKFGNRGVGNLTGRRPMPASPTQAAPGTPAKLEVMAERARRGERLWHPDDATVED